MTFVVLAGGSSRSGFRDHKTVPLSASMTSAARAVTFDGSLIAAEVADGNSAAPSSITTTPPHAFLIHDLPLEIRTPGTRVKLFHMSFATDKQTSDFDGVHACEKSELSKRDYAA